MFTSPSSDWAHSLLIFLIVALLSAIQSVRDSFTKLPKNIKDEGRSIYVKLCASLVAIWLALSFITALLSIEGYRRNSNALPKWIGPFSALATLFESAAVPLLLAIQTHMVSVCTKNTSHNSVQKVCRVAIWGVALILPLGIAEAVLNYLIFISGGSDKDMGHLGVMIAITIIHSAMIAIAFLAVLASIICLVKYKSIVSPASYYKTLLVVNGLSLTRYLYQIFHAVYFGIGFSIRLSYDAFLLRSFLTTIFTACTTTACLVLVVSMIAAYSADLRGSSSHADETSPLLQDDDRQGRANVDSA